MLVPGWQPRGIRDVIRWEDQGSKDVPNMVRRMNSGLCMSFSVRVVVGRLRRSYYYSMAVDRARLESLSTVGLGWIPP